MIQTDLFRLGMFAVAKQHGLDIFQPGFADALKAIKEKGFKIAIVSGVRTDIISGVLAITRFPVSFDFIIGQDPILSRDSNVALHDAARHGTVAYVVGDKLSDFSAAKEIGAKSVFVTWGHANGGEEAVADYTIKEAKELEKIIN